MNVDDKCDVKCKWIGNLSINDAMEIEKVISWKKSEDLKPSILSSEFVIFEANIGKEPTFLLKLEINSIGNAINLEKINLFSSCRIIEYYTASSSQILIGSGVVMRDQEEEEEEEMEYLQTTKNTEVEEGIFLSTLSLKEHRFTTLEPQRLQSAFGDKFTPVKNSIVLFLKVFCFIASFTCKISLLKYLAF